MVGNFETSKRRRISRSCIPLPDLMASTGSVNAALYGSSRRGFPCSSTSQSMVPLSALALMCDGCKLTRSPTLTVDWAVLTRKRGTTSSRPDLHRPDLEIPLNVFRVEHGA